MANSDKQVLTGEEHQPESALQKLQAESRYFAEAIEALDDPNRFKDPYIQARCNETLMETLVNGGTNEIHAARERMHTSPAAVRAEHIVGKLVRSLVRISDFDAAREEAATIKHPLTRAYAFMAIAEKSKDQKDLNAAVIALDGGVEPLADQVARDVKGVTVVDGNDAPETPSLIAGAMDFFAQMDGVEAPRIRAYFHLASISKNPEHYAKAVRMMRGLPSTDSVSKEHVNALTKMGQLAHARKVAHEASDPIKKLDAAMSIAQTTKEKEDRDAIVSVFNEYTDEVKEEEKSWSYKKNGATSKNMWHTYIGRAEELVDFFLAEGDKENAEMILMHYNLSGSPYSIQDETRRSMPERIIENDFVHLIYEEKFDEAEVIISKMLQQDFKVEAYMRLIQAAKNANANPARVYRLLDTVRTIVQEMSTDEPEGWSYVNDQKATAAAHIYAGSHELEDLLYARQIRTERSVGRDFPADPGTTENAMINKDWEQLRINRNQDSKFGDYVGLCTRFAEITNDPNDMIEAYSVAKKKEIYVEIVCSKLAAACARQKDDRLCDFFISRIQDSDIKFRTLLTAFILSKGLNNSSAGSADLPN